ncbi:hypothetical protein CR969_03050, partial [Candidatus Saccharibacteria bacterium]
ASQITNDSYLQHITRYIHMNPRNYLRYKWSSIGYYLGKQAPRWMSIDLVHNMTPQQYRQFLAEYEGKKAELELLKSQLTD